MVKKKVLWKSLSLGLAMMVLSSPAYAKNPFADMDPYKQSGDVIEQREQAERERQQAELDAERARQAEALKLKQAEDEKVLTPGAPWAPYIRKMITKQSVVGNTSISEADILAAVKTKPGMKFTEPGLREDLDAIYAMGYFYELNADFKEVPEGVQVIYKVQENPVYKGLKMSGVSAIPKGKAEGFFAKLPKGRVASLKEINKAVRDLEEEYRNQGYILARVTDVKMENDGTLNIAVNEGKVEGFKVKGNKKTKDHVITREMRMKPGDAFNSKLARRSMQRIHNLGFFEDVNIKLNPGMEPNSVIVEITVVEQNTGTFGIGAGYSSADGFIGMVSIGDKNFRGRGDSISVRWEFGGEDNRNYDFSFSRPWLDKKETRMTINLYDITNEYADYNEHANEIARYDKKRRGQELTFSRKTKNEFISNFITLKNRDDIYKGVADGYEDDKDQYYEDVFDKTNPKWRDWYPATAAERRRENFGVTRSITLGRVYDSRDNIYAAKSGKRIAYSIERTLGLGSDFSFTKYTADWRYYYKAGKHNPTNVWAWNFVAGYASGQMPLHQRFTMGGTDTLRGYEDDQFRGNSMLKATMEYRFPVVKKIEAVLFSDNGYAWDKRHEDYFDISKIKSSVGVGLRINSPLGPVKLDYGFGSDGGRFHFSFGGQF